MALSRNDYALLKTETTSRGRRLWTLSNPVSGPFPPSTGDATPDGSAAALQGVRVRGRSFDASRGRVPLQIVESGVNADLGATGPAWERSPVCVWPGMACGIANDLSCEVWTGMGSPNRSNRPQEKQK
ncbi:hypothetical protein H6P81_009340 [Aristolochia fimbriata]|uniref:Uncharacterized protein n=1 Tax=Aristolochia fimbriata TaxID=158543 RepID=A0AAV7EKK9_ARIFI|nr:hypothetical protein H6P81_009340 [Aristolochia fimbriata]